MLIYTSHENCNYLWALLLSLYIQHKNGLVLLSKFVYLYGQREYVILRNQG